MACKIVSIVFLCLVLSAIVVLCQDDGLTVELDSFVISKDYNTDYIDWNTLQMKKVGRNQFVISGTFITNLNLADEQTLNIQIYTYEAELKKRGPLLFVYDKEICKFIAEDEDIYPDLKEASTLPERDVCPMPKGEYTIKDYEIKADFLPADTPKGEYLIVSTIKDGTKAVAGLETYINIS